MKHSFSFLLFLVLILRDFQSPRNHRKWKDQRERGQTIKVKLMFGEKRSTVDENVTTATDVDSELVLNTKHTDLFVVCAFDA